VNMAIGVSSLKPIVDYRGMKDAYGCHLKVKMQAIGDEFAAATELNIG